MGARQKGCLASWPAAFNGQLLQPHFLWRLGGKGGFENAKSVRRIGCPIAIGIGVALSQNWIGLLSLPLLFAAFTTGYGPESFLMKRLNNPYLVRFICGILYALAGIFILYKNLWLFAFHLLICSLGVLLVGNQKFKWEDEREEFFIGMLVSWLPIFA